jgi:multidrug resistance protein MdtO
MATFTQTVPTPQGFRDFAAFLKEELAPYSGRLALVTRIVVAATLVAAICLTFRIPYGFQGAIFAFLISHEDLRATVTSALTLLVVAYLGALYLLVGVLLVVGSPMLHFLWNVGSFFLAFYLLSIVSSYFVGVVFAIMVSVGVPILDTYATPETKVENVLWLMLVIFIGVAATTATEFAFIRKEPGQAIAQHVADRLSAVHDLVLSYARDGFVNESAEKEVISFGVRGTSRLRMRLRRSDYQSHYRAQMGAVVALVGRLVDMAGALAQLRFTPTDTDRAHLRELASAIATVRDDLLNGGVPGPVRFHRGEESSHYLPLLSEMESIVALIPDSFVGSPDESILPAETSRPSLVVADAFVNPDHLKFALKGCLAAGGCYFIYNAIDWPGISTAVVTCLLTGLTTIGGSRQKQILRLTGAVVGGFVIGMGSQVFILPSLNSIGGFIILFALVSAFAAWFTTSTPRLSYFGVQVALAYYLINLSEFTIQTSLTVARDRVVGVLLGLTMMWLVFDQLWGAPAGVEMRRKFISTLRLLAQFSREPASRDIRAVIQRSYPLRETINSSFDMDRSVADGVLFEFGPSRRQNLQFRDEIRHWQPKLRTLFLTRIALLEDCVQLMRQFDLPETVRVSLQDYDDHSSLVLEGIADRIEGHAPEATSVYSIEPLERALNACCREEAPLLPVDRVRSLVALLRTIDALTTSLDKEITSAVG